MIRNLVLEMWALVITVRILVACLVILKWVSIRFVAIGLLGQSAQVASSFLISGQIAILRQG